MKINAKTIDTIKLPAGRSEIIAYDDEIAGFGVRIREGGSRVFVFTYKVVGKTRRLTLGPAVKEAFPDIRKQAFDLANQVRQGGDPAATKEAKIEAAKRQEAESFKAVVDLYLAQQRKTTRPNTYREVERYLLVKAERLHKMPLVTITKRDIATVINEAEAGVKRGKGGSATANRTLSVMSAMFSWAMREGLCELNPCLNTNKRDQSRRSRTLIDKSTGDMSELVAVWKALGSSGFDDAVRMLILTGQRRQEMGALKWSEIDQDVTVITLPPERQKNGGGEERLNHLIPLSGPAREILSRRHRVVGWECVFSRVPTGLGNWGRWKADLDAKLPGMPPWTLHDLRRSVATGMAKIGILPHVVEAVLNHIGGHKAGVAGIYNHATYEAEKAAALVRWAEHFMAAVMGEPAKVVPLRGAR
jgi:integrase